MMEKGILLVVFERGRCMDCDVGGKKASELRCVRDTGDQAVVLMEIRVRLGEIVT
jgi:hypothetical protein